MNRILVGSIAGILATYAMTAAMATMKRRLPAGQRHALPPRELTQRMLQPIIGADADWPSLSLGSHFAYGAAAGAAYGLIGRPAWWTGVPFGLGVWAASYLGWIPAAGLMSPATRHPPERTGLMIAAHVVWGAVLQATALHLHSLDAPMRNT